MHDTKINRACRIARKLPLAEAEILSSIPDDLRARLTAREIAMVMDCLDRHWHKARAFEAADILSEGCIWDPRIGKLREIGQPMNF